MKVSLQLTHGLQAWSILAHHLSTWGEKPSQRPLTPWSMDHYPNPVSPSGELDFLHMISFYIGTPPQIFSAALDLAATELVVLSAKRDHTFGIPNDNEYDSSKSNTYRPNGTLIVSDQFMWRYSGFLSGDVVQISNLVVDMLFEEVTSTTLRRCEECHQEDDLTMFPLAPYNASSPRNFMSPLAQLVDNNLLDENIFSLLLSRGNTDLSGELVLGGVVDEQFYEGTFVTIPTTSIPTPDLPDRIDCSLKEGWKVEAQSIALGDGPVIDFQFPNSTVAVLGTTHSWIMLPERLAEDIINLIDPDAEYWGPIAFVDCNKRMKMPHLTIVLAGQEFVLTPYDYLIELVFEKEPGNIYCISAFAPVLEEDTRIILLGSSFLSAWVSVFDLEESTVSFARAKHGPPNK